MVTVADQLEVSCTPLIENKASEAEEYFTPLQLTAFEETFDPAALCSPDKFFPREVKKLLSLELEVVQLQQTLHLIQLDLSTRSADLEYMRQTAASNEERAVSAERRLTELQLKYDGLKEDNNSLRFAVSEAVARNIASELEKKEMRVTLSRIAKQQTDNAQIAGWQPPAEKKLQKMHSCRLDEPKTEIALRTDIESNSQGAFDGSGYTLPTRKEDLIQDGSADQFKKPDKARRDPLKEFNKINRSLYGSDPTFQKIASFYKDIFATKLTGSNKWLRGVVSSQSAIETHPKVVESTMTKFITLFQEGGIALPIEKVGPCQYKMGSSKLLIKLVNGRLMAKSGPTSIDIVQWLEKQPIYCV